MPGPKPQARFVWRDMYRVTKRLHDASTTAEQRQVVDNLIRGLRQVEHLWGVYRDGEGRIIHAAIDAPNSVE